MNFINKKITNNHNNRGHIKSKKRGFLKNISSPKVMLFISILIVLISSYYAFGHISNSKIGSKIGEFRVSFMSNIKMTDGKTQILILGNGGGKHDGSKLTDSIIIASINHTNNHVTGLSIPRDLLVNTKDFGQIKINQLYTLGEKYQKEDKFHLIKKAASEISGYPVHYVAMIDFDGFVRIVDTLEGVEVDVENDFVDYNYPTDNFKWKTITFKKGLQTMNGKRALEFARSRHAIGIEGSDFARSKRQQKIIIAIINKLKDSNYFTNPDMIKNLYSAFGKIIETNIDFTDILSLSKLAYNIPKSNIAIHVLGDERYGLLYTPNASLREKHYQNMFFLVPIGNTYDQIHKFTDLIFGKPEIFTEENAKIEILNSTGQPGIASECKNKIEKYGFENVLVGNISNKREYIETEIYDHTMDEKPKTIKWLVEELDAKQVAVSYETQPTDADITIILGKNNNCR